MSYQWIKDPQEAKFIQRLNRFACQVDLEGKPTKVYLPNTGRLEELLIPGAAVILEKRRMSGKTLHDMLLVQSPRFPDGKPIWVGLDSRQPPALLRWAIEEQLLNVFGQVHSIRNEPSNDNGRFDLEILGERDTHMVETKSVNLIDASGIARFPDAPTRRGVKHLRSLIDLLSVGVQPWVVFVVMRQDAIAFSPFSERDPEFAETLECARDAGVKILALKFTAGRPLNKPTAGSKDSWIFPMTYVSDLDVLLPSMRFPASTPFPGFWSPNNPTSG
jgi:sugar fermentation stimulation protein A